MHRGCNLAGRARAQRIRSHQISRRPYHQAPAPKRCDRRSHDHVHCRTLTPEVTHCSHKRRRLAVLVAIKTAASWLADSRIKPDGKYDTGEAQPDKYLSPPELIGDAAGKAGGDPDADRR